MKDSAKIETLQCVAAGTANHQQGIEACTEYGRFEIVLESDKSVPKLSALH